MKFIPIVLLTVFWMTASSQKSPKIEVSSDTITWNGAAVNQEGAFALEINTVILRYDVDPERNMVYIQTYPGTNEYPSRKGKLIAFDTGSNKIRWSLDMRYTDDYFILADSIPILYHRSFSSAYNWKTGDEIWKHKGQIVFSALSESLAIGFDRSYDYHDNVYALNVHSGNQMWRTTVQTEIELESAQFYSDTALACLSEGLIYLNLKTGKHFFLKQKLHKPNAGRIAVFAGAGVLGGIFGLIFAAAMYSNPSPKVAVGNLQTSFIFYEDHFYSFHKDELRKYNMVGEIIWAVNCLQYTGAPKFFVNKGDLFVVQDGIERRTDGSLGYGDSGIMRVGTAMGEVKAAKQFTSQKENRVRDYIIKDSTIVVATESKIGEYSLIDFKALKENDFGGRNTRLGFSKILNPPGYIESKGNFRNATKENPNHFYTTNTADQKIEFDGDFEMVSVVRKRNFFQERVTFPSGLKCLENEYKVVFVEEDNQQVGDIFFTPNMQIEKDYILDRTENQILFLPDDAIGGLQ